jgi:hypothetical protein
MGHSRRFELCGRMSAFTPKASAKADMGGQSNRAASSRMRSDFDLLRYGQGVVNIDAQISHRALNLRVSKQKLNRT